MKTLCSKKTDESFHIFSDSTEIYLSGDSLWFKYNNREDFEIKGYSENDYIIYENVEDLPYWLNRTYKYNPKYGWKYIEEYSQGKEEYEFFLEYFFKTCFLLKEKNLLTVDEYESLMDFSDVEKFLYHPISYYFPK